MRIFRAWNAAVLVFGLILGLACVGAFVRSAAAQEKKQDEKKSDKKDKKQPKESEATGNEPLDMAAERKNIQRVLRSFQDGFEGKSPRRVAELLDSATFYDFPRFEDLVTQFLEQNAEMRMYLRESTAEVKGNKATLIVDADMTFTDKSNPSAEKKRRQRIQFDFIRTPKGWKIYEINPRTFFTP